MSHDFSVISPQRFLPRTLKDLLICWTARLGGVLLVAAAGVLWLSLLTWSAHDPSFSTASSVEPANILGSFGATFADLLLQVFGLSSVVLLSCLLVWGLRLSMVDYIDRFRMRGALAILSLLSLSGSFSALSASGRWAFLHGYGGILGDLSYNLTAGLFTPLMGQAGGLAAGLVMLGLGCLCFIYAIGVEREPFFNIGPLTIGKVFKRAVDGVQHVSEPAVQESDVRTEPKFDLSNLNPAQSRLVEFGQVGHVGNETGEIPDLPSDHDQLCAQKIAKRFSPNNVNGSDRKDDGLVQQMIAGQQLHDAADRQKAVLPAFDHQANRETKRPQSGGGYRQPSLDELQSPPAAADDVAAAAHAAELEQTAEALTKVLKDFRVKGEMRDIRPGPVVTLFEFEPAPGTKASRIISLADDIARSMSAESARIAVIPGRNAIGIEIPNDVREKVLLRDVFESEAYRNCDARLPLALGKGIDGKPVIADLTRMPHLLVAGTTGSGKSVGINAMILSLLYRKSPKDCRLLMIDPKMLELSAYNGIPHLLAPVITDPDHAVLALQWAIREMEGRYKKMTEMGARSIEVFNNRVRHALQSGGPLRQQVHVGFDPDTGEAQFRDKVLNFEPMPYIVIIVDEFADLMAVAGKEIDISIKRLAQMARAAGIHLIMATQRPSVDVVTGTIKANFPTRVAFKVASKIDSRTIVNCSGAEQLLGQGDLLLANGSSPMIRAHGAFVSDDEVESVGHALQMQGQQNYVDDLVALMERGEDKTRHDNGEEKLFERALALMHKGESLSVDLLRKKLSISKRRAVSLMKRLESSDFTTSHTEADGVDKIVA